MHPVCTFETEVRQHTGGGPEDPGSKTEGPGGGRNGGREVQETEEVREGEGEGDGGDGGGGGGVAEEGGGTDGWAGKGDGGDELCLFLYSEFG